MAADAHSTSTPGKGDPLPFRHSATTLSLVLSLLFLSLCWPAFGATDLNELFQDATFGGLICRKASYVASIGVGAVDIDARFDLHAVGEGPWSAFRVFGEGGRCRIVETSGAPAPARLALHRGPGGGWYLLSRQEGSFQIRLLLQVRAEEGPDGWQVALPLPRATVAHVQLRSERHLEDLNLSPAVLTTEPVVGANVGTVPETFKQYLLRPSTEGWNLRWRDPAALATAKRHTARGRVFADEITSRFTLEDRRVRCTIRCRFDLPVALDEDVELRLRWPAGFSNRLVEGSSGVDVVARRDGALLRLGRGHQGSFQVSGSADRPLDDLDEDAEAELDLTAPRVTGSPLLVQGPRYLFFTSLTFHDWELRTEELGSRGLRALSPAALRQLVAEGEPHVTEAYRIERDDACLPIRLHGGVRADGARFRINDLEARSRLNDPIQADVVKLSFTVPPQPATTIYLRLPDGGGCGFFEVDGERRVPKRVAEREDLRRIRLGRLDGEQSVKMNLSLPYVKLDGMGVIAQTLPEFFTSIPPQSLATPSPETSSSESSAPSPTSSSSGKGELASVGTASNSTSSPPATTAAEALVPEPAVEAGPGGEHSETVPNLSGTTAGGAEGDGKKVEIHRAEPIPSAGDIDVVALGLRWKLTVPGDMDFRFRNSAFQAPLRDGGFFLARAALRLARACVTLVRRHLVVIGLLVLLAVGLLYVVAMDPGDWAGRILLALGLGLMALLLVHWASLGRTGGEGASPEGLATGVSQGVADLPSGGVDITPSAQPQPGRPILPLSRSLAGRVVDELRGIVTGQSEQLQAVPGLAPFSGGDAPLHGRPSSGGMPLPAGPAFQAGSPSLGSAAPSDEALAPVSPVSLPAVPVSGGGSHGAEKDFGLGWTMGDAVQAREIELLLPAHHFASDEAAPGFQAVFIGHGMRMILHGLAFFLGLGLFVLVFMMLRGLFHRQGPLVLGLFFLLVLLLEGLSPESVDVALGTSLLLAISMGVAKSVTVVMQQMERQRRRRYAAAGKGDFAEEGADALESHLWRDRTKNVFSFDDVLVDEEGIEFLLPQGSDGEGGERS